MFVFSEFSEKVRLYSQSPVNVYVNGTLFYFAKADKFFNLPKGKYKISGSYDVLPFRLPDVSINFHEPEKNVKFSGIKKIVFADNANKCSVDINKGLVIFDKKFYKTLKKHEFLFIIYHEIGHYFYYKEKYCDDFATACLLNTGYNPSQLFNVSKKTLFSTTRKLHNYNSLKKAKK